MDEGRIARVALRLAGEASGGEAGGRWSPAGGGPSAGRAGSRHEPLWYMEDEFSFDADGAPVTVRVRAYFDDEDDLFIKGWEGPRRFFSHDPYEPDDFSEGEVDFRTFPEFLERTPYYLDSVEAEPASGWDAAMERLSGAGRTEFAGTPFSCEGGRIVVSDEDALLSKFQRAYNAFLDYWRENFQDDFFRGLEEDDGLDYLRDELV